MKIAKEPLLSATFENIARATSRFEAVPGGVTLITSVFYSKGGSIEMSEFVPSSEAHRLHRELEIALGL